MANKWVVASIGAFLFLAVGLPASSQDLSGQHGQLTRELNGIEIPAALHQIYSLAQALDFNVYPDQDKLRSLGRKKNYSLEALSTKRDSLEGLLQMYGAFRVEVDDINPPYGHGDPYLVDVLVHDLPGHPDSLSAELKQLDCDVVPYMFSDHSGTWSARVTVPLRNLEESLPHLVSGSNRLHMSLVDNGFKPHNFTSFGTGPLPDSAAEKKTVPSNRESSSR